MSHEPPLITSLGVAVPSIEDAAIIDSCRLVPTYEGGAFGHCLQMNTRPVGDIAQKLPVMGRRHNRSFRRPERVGECISERDSYIM